ncbi:MAG: 8-amino-7-oxononanoate synthase, partial [Roseibacillus sp.]|nr:8-amino-7-oxononanoate synthase [Roseibacillus sp.]
MRQAEDELAALREAGLLRQLQPLEADHPPLLRLDGRPVVNFASNDYLGLACDEELMAAAREAIARYGTGSGSSRLISGSLSPHLDLEEHIA